MLDLKYIEEGIGGLPPFLVQPEDNLSLFYITPVFYSSKGPFQDLGKIRSSALAISFLEDMILLNQMISHAEG